MSGVDTCVFDDTKWFVWAPTRKSAEQKVTAHLKTLGFQGFALKVGGAGLVRPAGYEYSRDKIRTGALKGGKFEKVEGDEFEGRDLMGRLIGGGHESSPQSQTRWTVTLK